VLPGGQQLLRRMLLRVAAGGGSSCKPVTMRGQKPLLLSVPAKPSSFSCCGYRSSCSSLFYYLHILQCPMLRY
jgi:hypothetical protein